MSKPASDTDTTDGMTRRCTNCDAPLTRTYCSVCGQKDVSLDRPALALLRDVLDGFFSLDGKFWRTVFGLYRHPGRAAREFVDGRRARNSPPVRLYVIAALVFVLGFQASGIALIGIHTEGGNLVSGADLGQSELAAVSTGPVNVRLHPFRPPWSDDPVPINWEAIRAAIAAREGVPLSESSAAEISEQDMLQQGGLVALAVLVGRDPLAAERSANLALNQAMLAMVVLFAVFNAVLHPRARLVTHIVHSLYFHAALLPWTAISAIAAVFITGVWAVLGTVLGIVGMGGALILAWKSDRAVYASSWYGASLRVVVLTLLYLIAFLALAIALVLMAIL